MVKYVGNLFALSFYEVQLNYKPMYCANSGGGSKLNYKIEEGKEVK